MPSLEWLPARDRPAGFPVPPARMRIWRDGRPLKRWCYAGLYGEELMACAAVVAIGGLPQAFWATWDRRELRERTTFRPGAVHVSAARVRGGPLDLRLVPDGTPVEVTSRHGGSYIWTRKRPVRAEGTVAGRPVALRGLLDESAGYHARVTAWRWCAGTGEDAAGRPLTWNLVEGVHDAPSGSERTLWIGGEPRELPAGAFAADLSAVRWPGGEELRFAEEARRARRDDLGLLASDYAQPFGTFSGTLPGGVALARGWGVMERHDVRW